MKKSQLKHIVTRIRNKFNNTTS